MVCDVIEVEPQSSMWSASKACGAYKVNDVVDDVGGSARVREILNVGRGSAYGECSHENAEEHLRCGDKDNSINNSSNHLGHLEHYCIGLEVKQRTAIGTMGLKHTMQRRTASTCISQNYS